MTSVSLGLLLISMISAADPFNVIFGGLGGVAALVVAINTWLTRREAKAEKKRREEIEQKQHDEVERMDTFELSQASLQAALTRADAENARLLARLEKQDEKIEAQAGEIRELKTQVRKLTRELEECHRDKPGT